MTLFAQAIPPEWWRPMLFAAFGSFAIGFVEWVRVWQLRGPKRRKIKDPVDYFIWAVGFPVIAAGVAAAYLDANQPLNGVMALQVGASAPLIIRSLAKLAPPGDDEAHPTDAGVATPDRPGGPPGPPPKQPKTSPGPKSPP